MKFGLRGTRKLLQALGNPHLSLPAIHVAGTNGKGSTASLLAAAFTAAGYKTGLYTSPHLINFTERIRIDGKPISEESVARYTEILQGQILHQKATFFEATTAIALAYFVEQKVDIAIIETGLGGRLDSTNVLKPLASVITNIALDHTDILGGEIGKIAREKGGIIKKRVPCYTSIDNALALKEVEKICKRRKAPLTIVKRTQVQGKKSSLSGSVVNAKVGRKAYSALEVSLPGSFQHANIALALSIIQGINQSERYRVSEKAMREGFANVQEYSGIQGRLAVIKKNPLIIADVAHNGAAMESLINALQEFNINQIDVLFGVMRDKDYRKMIKALKLIARKVIAVAPHIERAKPVQDLILAFTLCGATAFPAENVEQGVKLILQNRNKKVPILITGSHYVVGEAMEFLRRNNT
ncbi:MAG: bifunctional folylpolyglutamate synthase/dihydrofolate synthase [Ignavibacteriales bacterium]|nr:bifunctional folylpolyglutamate synthase/dihydrofolate synthase [Ignavibacteriales bacterium]